MSIYDSKFPVSFGNTKLSKNIMILNMCSASDCPADLLGMCPLGKNGSAKCYALKAEKLWKEVLPFHKKQEKLWDDHTSQELKEIFDDVLKRRRIKVKYFRFNESGDFKSQKDVEKLDQLAKHLASKWGITTYGYSSRKDLDFSRVSFIIKGSRFQTKDGQTDVFVDTPPKGYFVCPKKRGNNIKCGEDCTACMRPGNVAFRLH